MRDNSAFDSFTKPCHIGVWKSARAHFRKKTTNDPHHSEILDLGCFSVGSIRNTAHPKKCTTKVWVILSSSKLLPSKGLAKDKMNTD